MISHWNSRRSAIWAGVALAFAFATSAAHAQDVIKIAAGAPLTGPLAKQGQEVANAVQLAVDEWNAKGGVLGKKIEMIAADDQGNPQVGVAAGEKVAADPAVLGTVWGITSSTCIPVSEVLDRVNLVMITPGCSNPKVTDRGVEDRQPAVRPRRFPGPGRHHLRSSTSSRRRRSRSSTMAPPARAAPRTRPRSRPRPWARRRCAS